MSIQIVKFEPSKKARNNGAIALVIAIEAPNKKAAEVMATGKLREAYPAAADNFLKPEIVEDQPGCPRPAVGVFDEQFAIDNELNSELKCWQPRAVEAPPAGPVDLLKQPSKLKIAAVAMYGANEIDHSMLSLAQDLIDNDEPEDESGMLDIINGLNAVPAVGAMFPAAIETLIAAIINHFGEAVPTEAGAKDFAKKWVARPGAREKMVEDSSTSTSTSTEGTGGVSDYNTLSMHTALSIMAINPTDAKASDVKNAKEIIASRDSVWRAWDKTFRVITGILDVDTDTRHSIISDGLKNLKLVNNDDERLHFVKSRLAGNPACPELANYGQQPNPQPEVESLGHGKFTIEGLMGEQPNTTSSEGEKTEVATTEPVSDAAALQAKEALDNLGYGVYATETEQKSELLQRAEDNAAAAAQLVQQLHADDFQQRANQVEQALADQPQEDRDNLGIWNRVYKTDAKFTKAFANNGGGTSINGTYMVMQATKVFGPHGINWGVDVLEERFDNGAPIMQPVKQPDGSFVKGIVSNGTGGYLCEVNHTVKIRLWYKQDGKTGEVLAYGCTPYIYGTKNGAMSDGEAPKKSLTDATKKALSQLGFSADVFLGLYDDVNYREENDAEFALKNASEKAEGVTRLREELDEKLTKVAETISKAVTVNEANKVHASIAREVDAHRKAFEAKGDTEHAKYLAGRLRRLTTLKDERIKALSASEEKTQ
ncbi:hypothetical protein ABQ366_21090 [Serratia fonticola]|uniref:hypothetical protein n=1 Tax=Serratia fonticola TaxID=47917 RepID=UPI003AAC62AE